MLVHPPGCGAGRLLRAMRRARGRPNVAHNARQSTRVKAVIFAVLFSAEDALFFSISAAKFLVGVFLGQRPRVSSESMYHRVGYLVPEQRFERVSALLQHIPDSYTVDARGVADLYP